MSKPSKSKIKPTDEQIAIIEAVRRGDSVIGEARAGTAKTTTAVLSAEATADRKVPKLFLAFNVRIRDELQKRLPEGWVSKTFNGLGHGIVMANARLFNEGRITLEPGKARDIAHRFLENDAVPAILLKSFDIQRAELSDLLVGCLDFCKTYGYKAGSVQPINVPSILEGCAEVSESVIKSRKNVEYDTVAKLFNGMLSMNLDMARKQGVIDFNDQIYLSALYCPNPGKKYSIVIVDEGQDASPLNFKQVARVTTDQLVVLGDRHQSLYGFRGAVGSFADMAKKTWPKEFTHLSLTRTFRCPRVVVARQRQIGVRDYRAAKGNLIGDVHIPFVSAKSERTKGAAWSFKAFVRRGLTDAKFNRTAAIARTNAELVIALLFAQKEGLTERHVTYAGRLPSMADLRKASSYRSATECPGFHGALNYYMRYRGLNIKEARAEFERFSSIDQKTGYASTPLVLTTVHGSKGLEYDAVLLIEPTAGLKETGNLRYVAETRTRNFLAGANLGDHDRLGKGHAAIVYGVLQRNPPVILTVKGAIHRQQDEIPRPYVYAERTSLDAAERCLFQVAMEESQ